MLGLGGEGLREVDRGGGGGRGRPEERGERLHLVAGLDLLDVVEVGGAEELGAVDDEGLGGAGGRVALPAGAGQEEGAGAVPRGAAAGRRS